eukprot:jgi/Picsp_1/85/NSC_00085-R1_---NA---
MKVTLMASVVILCNLLPSAAAPGETKHDDIIRNTRDDIFIYKDGDIDQDWSDWSFGFLKKGVREEGSGKPYCIDLSKYGGLSFETADPMPFEEMALSLRIRANGSSVGMDQLAGLQIQVESVAVKAKTYYVSSPVSLRDLVVGSQGEQQGEEETVAMLEDLMKGEWVEIQVKLSDIIDGQDWEGDTFNQITIGPCLTQDCRESNDLEKDMISFCVEEASVRPSMNATTATSS